jgi:hypothetical protein
MIQPLCLGLLSGILFFETSSLAQPANGTAVESAQQRDNLQQCRSIPDSAERLRCYEKAAAAQTKELQPATEGGWQLLRTPNPQGGADAVSIMRSADLVQSDPDLAGLMVRCAPKNQEVLIVMIQPVPPGAQPHVDIGVAGRTTGYKATVLPPGLAILLPGDAAGLVEQWQQVPELSIAIDEGQAKVRGIVPTAGLQAAFQLLQANCPI